LLRANHKNTKWRGIELKKGQFVTSYQSLSEATGLSIRNVRTSLKKLTSKTTNELTHKTTNHYSIITVNNWNLYQKSDKQNDKQTDKQVTTDNKQINNSNISYINISSSSNSKKDLPQISEEEEKLLRKRAEKNKIKYFKPWLRKILTNGDYVEILNEEKKKHKVVEDKSNEMKENFKKVKDKYKASMFIGMYGDYTDENHPEEVKLLMEKYDIPSFTEAVRYQHEYKKN
jgi:uncharacterized transporter YbjL